MPAPALRFEVPTFAPTFVESITNYIIVTCRAYRVRREDVFDVVQEALTKIVASVGSFRPEKGDFDTWARGVALNVIRRYSRDAKRHGKHFSEYYPNIDDYATHAPSPERCVQRKQAYLSISNALKTLTAQQASVIVLFDIDDMPHKEIGNDLDITESASHKCHKRARKQLAQCLDRDLLSVMPPFLTGCNDPGSSSEIGSRWTERSHYVGQIVATILAFLTYVPSCLELQNHESKTEEARVLGHVQNVVMYRSDERAAVHDEPAVFRDAPTGKPEPASRPSVHNVPTPAKVGDKRTHLQDLAPIPPFKPAPGSADHPLLGR